MDINTIGQLIGSVGFPIAACVVMFYQNTKMQETLSKLSETLTLMNERLHDVETAVKSETKGVVTNDTTTNFKY